MRVIGGKFKGKKLIEPKDKETRPLKDLTKESIFNIIKHPWHFSICANGFPVANDRQHSPEHAQETCWPPSY